MENIIESITSFKYDIPLPKWFASDIVRWGVTPPIAANVGFWSCVIVLEAIIALNIMKPIECKFSLPTLLRFILNGAAHSLICVDVQWRR